MNNIYNQGMTTMMPSMGQATTPYSYSNQPSADIYTQRLINMAQQVLPQQNGYNNQMQPNMIQGNMNGFMHNQGQSTNYSVRAVTGYEEAVASQIPFDGTITIFVDRAHNKLYTKQLNTNDGTALLKTYSLTENPKSNISNVENSVEYVEKAEFEEVKSKLDELWNALTVPTEKTTEVKQKSEKKEGK